VGPEGRAPGLGNDAALGLRDPGGQKIAVIGGMALVVAANENRCGGADRCKVQLPPAHGDQRVGHVAGPAFGKTLSECGAITAREKGVTIDDAVPRRCRVQHEPSKTDPCELATTGSGRSDSLMTAATKAA